MSDPEMFTPGEAARVLFCDRKTAVRRAAKHGITTVRTLGGHRRFVAAEIRELAKQQVGRRAW
jgi:excisionase family DNA binding protein